jgi:hypothetical protein
MDPEISQDGPPGFIPLNFFSIKGEMFFSLALPLAVALRNLSCSSDVTTVHSVTNPRDCSTALLAKLFPDRF